MIRRKVIVILLSVVFFSCKAQTATKLTADDFEKAIAANKNAQVLDVRTPGEFFSGHIKNAFQADWNDQKEFNRSIAFVDKTNPVYVYCLAGGRSAAAADVLRKQGYENVYELKGGTIAWKAADKSLEGKSTAKQMSVEIFNAAINSSKPVLVDFGAAWCPPCKVMEPVLKNLQDKHPGKFKLVKVDGGNDQDILKLYQVTTLPVFIIFKDGKQTWRREGITNEKELLEQLQ